MCTAYELDQLIIIKFEIWSFHGGENSSWGLWVSLGLWRRVVLWQDTKVSEVQYYTASQHRRPRLVMQFICLLG
jgi:hypothetical protein